MLVILKTHLLKCFMVLMVVFRQCSAGLSRLAKSSAWPIFYLNLDEVFIKSKKVLANVSAHMRCVYAHD